MVVISTSGMVPTGIGDWFSGSVSPHAMPVHECIAIVVGEVPGHVECRIGHGGHFDIGDGAHGHW
jgi:hypothetical protein